jgi:uncharacterized protein (DUF302 family)
MWEVMSGCKFQRLGVVMEPEPGKAQESEGVLNPETATYQAILAEENIGLMLPCNVIVYEKGSKTVLSVIRPTIAMRMIDNVELHKVAKQVEGPLKKAFDAIK